MAGSPNGLVAGSAVSETAAPAGGKAGPSVAVLVGAEEIASYQKAWESLAAEALEPNCFYEPWALLPAVRWLALKDLRFLLIFVREEEREVLAGLWPLEFGRRCRGIPIRTARLWKHRQCYSCTPLVHARYGRQVVSAVLDWLAGEQAECRVLELPTIPGEGALHRLLVEQLGERQILSYTTDVYLRPMLRPRGDATVYLQRVLTNDRRRSLARRERQLAQQGCVEFDLLEPGDDIDAWSAEYLELEAGGWKGRAGSALACDPADRQCFQVMMREAFARGRLMAVALRLNGEAIAMVINFGAGGRFFCYKTTFAERYHRWGPGILLETHLVRLLHERGDVAWIDSCTMPGNEVLSEFWQDRRPIQTLVISSRRRPADLLVSSLPLLRWARRKVQLRR